MVVGSFLHRLQPVASRRRLSRIQRWIGIGVGLYVAAIAASGAVLLFRPEIQNAAWRDFRHVTQSTWHPEASASAIIRALQRAYPRDRLIEIDWPTYGRETFLAYLDRDNQIRMVFVHPTTANVLGEVPEPSWIRWLRELHLTLLLAGKTGMTGHGVGTRCLLAMCITGFLIWWRGVARFRQAPGVDVRKGWKRVRWELPRAIGFLMWAFLAMWAVTGLALVLARPAGSIVNALASTRSSHQPRSNPALRGRHQPPAPEQLIVTAQYLFPGAAMARLIPPAVASDPWLIILAPRGHVDAGDELSAFFDQYSGGVLQARDRPERSLDDTMVARLGMLHVGSFGGLIVKVMWAGFALSLPVLFFRTKASPRAA
jgi:uncharacterized iron-regulated membrane protein